MESNLYGKTSILTYSGLTFDYSEMNPESIAIEDIAHALSYIPRWAGHTQVFYSVAQHLCWCHDNIENKEFAFEALMHDTTEAYLGDCPKPLKNLLIDYMILEENLSLIIAKKFGYSYPHNSEIKVVDKKALLWEYNNIKIASPGVDVWHYERAEQEFLNRFYKYVAIPVTQNKKHE